MEKYIEKQIEGEDFIDKLRQKAEKTLSEYAISMDDFNYKDLEEDKAAVERMKAGYQRNDSDEEKEAKVLADILEAIILEESESSNWFGQSASTIKTSDYDDYINHIDTIIEFEKEESIKPDCIALGIDATFSTNINKKFDIIKKEMESGTLAQIKYFSSSRAKGIYLQVPRLVVGADVKTIKKLGELWLDKDSNAEGAKREAKRALENHPAQFQLLKQMILEAGAFEKYAQKINRPEIAELYAGLKKLIQKIYDDKNPKQNDKGDYDNMIDIIKSNLKSFE